MCAGRGVFRGETRAGECGRVKMGEVRTEMWDGGEGARVAVGERGGAELVGGGRWPRGCPRGSGEADEDGDSIEELRRAGRGDCELALAARKELRASAGEEGGAAVEGRGWRAGARPIAGW